MSNTTLNPAQLSHLSAAQIWDALASSDPNAPISRQLTPEKMSLGKKVALGIFTLGIGAAVVHIKEQREAQKAQALAQDIVKLKNDLKIMDQWQDKGASSFTAKLGEEYFSVQLDVNGQLQARFDGEEEAHLFPHTPQEVYRSIEDNIVEDVNFYGQQEALDVIEDNRPPAEAPTAEQLERSRELSLKALTAATGLNAAEFSSISNGLILHAAAQAVSNHLPTETFLERIIYPLKNADLINSEDANILLYKFEELERTAPELAQQRVTMPEAAVSAKPALLEGIEDQELLDAMQNRGILTEAARIGISTPEIKAQMQAVRPAAEERAQQVRDFYADLVYPEQTWVHDKYAETRGEMLRQTLIKHADAAAFLSRYSAAAVLLGSAAGQGGEAAVQLRDTADFINKEILALIPAEQRSDPAAVINFLQTKEAGYFAPAEQKLNQEIDAKFSAIQELVTRNIDDIFGSGSAQPAEQSAAPAAEDTAAQPATLDDWLKAGDKNAGYSRFLKVALQSYFKDIPTIDKRSMVGSFLREASPQASSGKLIGAFMKGAGPIMQKTLQGMNPDNFDNDFKDAVIDMKSRLNPIPDRIIQAYLADIVARSHGEIVNITMQRSLGAATVGQALLCTFTDKEGQTQECVVKILRPDVRNRAAREKEIFIAASKQVPGMEVTFAGQLKRIEEEFDLTNEAKNIKAGNQAYDPIPKDDPKALLRTMSLSTLVEAAPNVMVLEKAPGVTVDSMRSTMQERLKSIEQKYGLGPAEEGQTPPPLERSALESCQRELAELLTEYEACQQQLISLTNLWVTQGLYGSGFYHGDLHAGNIMFDKARGMTVIDFGNATQLNQEQQQAVTLMAAAACVSDQEYFLKGFRSLLSPEGQQIYRQKRAEVENLMSRIFSLEQQDKNKTGVRIAVALQELQKLGLELPAPIFNFSQCQLRLQNTIDSINAGMDELKAAMQDAAGRQPPLHELSIYDLSSRYLSEGQDLLRQAQMMSLSADDSKLKSRLRLVQQQMLETRIADSVFRACGEERPELTLLYGALADRLLNGMVNLSDAEQELPAFSSKTFIRQAMQEVQQADPTKRSDWFNQVMQQNPEMQQRLEALQGAERSADPTVQYNAEVRFAADLTSIEESKAIRLYSRILDARWLNGHIMANVAVADTYNTLMAAADAVNQDEATYAALADAVNQDEAAYAALADAVNQDEAAYAALADAKNDFVTALVSAELPKVEQVSAQTLKLAELNAVRHESFTEAMADVVNSNLKATIRRVGTWFALRHKHDL